MPPIRPFLRGLSTMLAPGLICLGLLTACDAGIDSGLSPNVPPEALWEKLPGFPLEPRAGAVTLYTGEQVLVIGGDPTTPCPAGADCAAEGPFARNGAALDVKADHWSTLADAPVGIPASAAAAFVGGHAFVQVGRELLDYDVAADRWTTLPRSVAPSRSLVADGDRLLVISPSDENGLLPDLAYDVRSGHWSRLPDDPLGPAYDRVITPTPTGIVLTAKKIVANPGGGDKPSFVIAAYLDRATTGWRRLEDSDQLGGWRWASINGRLVDITLESSDGGGPAPGDYGRQIPSGGILDPLRDRWTRLPNPPEAQSGGWNVEAAGTRLVAAEGYVYDDASGSWLRIPRPPGAPDRAGTAVWAEDRLVVVGGIDGDEHSDQTWSWEPVIGAFQ